MEHDYLAPGTGWLRYNLIVSTKRKDTRTYADRREYLIGAVAKRRKDLRLKATKLLGGKCQICGYGKHMSVLDFHHIDPSTKSFGISSGGFSRSWASIEAEVKKCILVCANCHREIELGLVELSEEHLQSVNKSLE